MNSAMRPSIGWAGWKIKESSAFLEKSFDAIKDDAHILDSLIFAISCHEGPQARAFLKKTAAGTRPGKVREKAIFWLGNAGDAQALADLKEIYAKEQDGAFTENHVCKGVGVYLSRCSKEQVTSAKHNFISQSYFKLFISDLPWFSPPKAGSTS